MGRVRRNNEPGSGMGTFTAKFDLDGVPARKPTPQEVRAARTTVADAAVTGGWETEVPELLAMLGLDNEEDDHG